MVVAACVKVFLAHGCLNTHEHEEQLLVWWGTCLASAPGHRWRGGWVRGAPGQWALCPVGSDLSRTPSSPSPKKHGGGLDRLHSVTLSMHPVAVSAASQPRPFTAAARSPALAH